MVESEDLPLGSKHALSNGSEADEMTDLLVAFEQENKCKITLLISAQLKKGYMDLCWTAVALGMLTQEPDQPPSVLASVSVWAGDFKTLMALVSRLLYALDFQLALNEFDTVPTKKA